MKTLFSTLLLIILCIPSILFANDSSYELGLSWLKKGNSIEAVKHFEKALQEAPNSIEIKKALAELFLKIKPILKHYQFLKNW